MKDGMRIWDKVSKPPKEALKKIIGGRLKGMTDINPQWRLKAMTEQYGPCGIGWYYTIDKQWTEAGSLDQVCCFSNISLYTKEGDEWSKPIPGTGGSMLVVKEKAGLHTSDEGFKMATTDAISVAMKALGVGADIYMGMWDGASYKNQEDNFITKAQVEEINKGLTEKNIDLGQFLTYMAADKIENISDSDYRKAMNAIKIATGRKEK